MDGFDLLMKLIDERLSTLPADAPKEERIQEAFGYALAIAAMYLEQEYKRQQATPVMHFSGTSDTYTRRLVVHATTGTTTKMVVL